MIEDITYGKLYEKLREFGFIQHQIELEGKSRYVFEHKTRANAMIVLPVRGQDEPVEALHMRSVLTTLQAHHLDGKRNPLTA